jgi:hypothetical protein
LTICFIGVADRGLSRGGSPSPGSRNDSQRDYVAANGGLLDPKFLGKIVGARDMLLTSEE